MSHWRQAALQGGGTLAASASGSTSIAATQSEPGLELSALIDDLHAELGLLPPAQIESDNGDDTTMPTWDIPLRSDRFEYGTCGNTSSESENLPTVQSLDLGSGSDSAASAKLSNYDLAVDWSTDIGYSSGSEADVESDIESHPELDDLLQMTPMSSRAGSPVGGNEIDHMEELEHEVSLRSNATFFYSSVSIQASAAPDGPRSEDPSSISQPDPETPNTELKLPDALRAFREWVLKMTSDGDLTIAAAESFLRTLNMCMEKDLLRCGPQEDPGEFYVLH